MRQLFVLFLLVAVPCLAIGQDAGVVGKQVDRFTLQDYRGKEWRLDEFSDRDAVVIAFLGTECPLVKLYSQRLEEMSQSYAERGVAFVGINSNQQDSLTEISHFARTHGIKFPLLKDPGNKVADGFGATRTPEVFVLDRQRRVRYHGRIDDQYTYGIQRPKVEHQYLQEAIDALLTGEPVAISETEAVGCLMGKVKQPDPDSDVTYSKQISRIIQKRCISCHRTGEIAPFSLASYDEAVGWAEMIAEVVDQQRMPPWHANPEHGDFVNDTRLTDEEKRLINDWVAAGAPEGDPSDLPEPTAFVEGWQIGQPDMIVKMADKHYHVPAEGEVKYQYFTVDPGFKEDKWIQAAECRPGNRAVVHHIIVAALSRDRLAGRFHGDLESDWITATAPGARPLILPADMAKRVPAGSRLLFQMHYTPNGTPQEDLSSVGLIFADPKTVKREVATQKAATHRFTIPPGADNHRVEANYRFKQDTLMLSMFPHMHLRGKAFRYTLTYPDNHEEILLDVPHYDFNWQNSYEFHEPRLIPAGSRMTCVAHFDNSANNLANPDPTASVRWGDQTWEEMMIGYFDIALADQDLTRQVSTRRVDRFLQRTKEQPLKLSESLRRLASGGLASDESLKAVGAELRKLVPQLDRVDWMTVESGTLEIRAVSQAIGSRQTGSGVKVPAGQLRIAKYAAGSQVVVNSNTGSINTPDFKLMSRFFGSSLHVPVRVDGAEGVVSFWSTEADAFPEQAVVFLEQTAKALGRR